MRHCVAAEPGGMERAVDDLEMPWRLPEAPLVYTPIKDALCTEISLVSRLCCCFVPHNTARQQDEGGQRFQAGPCLAI